MMRDQSPFYIKLSHGLIIVVLILGILYEAQNIFMPLAFAGLFAILLITPCRFFEKQGFSRGVAALISVILALMFFLVISYFISSQILNFRTDIPVVIKQVSKALIDLEEKVKARFQISSHSMDEFLNTVTNKMLSFSFFTSTFNTLSNTLLYFFVIVLYIFLLLLYRHLIVQFLIKSFSEDKEKVYVILNKTRYVIKSYLVGIIIEMIIVAFLNCVGFLLLGVRYALLLGVIAAILNLVPYLGIFIACILSMLITFTTNSGATVIGVGIVLLVVHLVDGNFLFPRIVGSKVKMNALATILGVIIGSTLWGIPGMFLAIPIIAIMKVIFEEVEGLQAWCTLLGDDGPVRVSAGTVIKRLRNSLSRKKTKT